MVGRKWIRLMSCAVAALFMACTTKIPRPTAAPLRPATDNYYGIQVVDNYRYMEDLKNPEVQTWIKGQADYAAAMLKSIPGRNRMFKRIQELDAGRPYRISGITREPDSTMYYFKMLASENVKKLFVRQGIQGPEKLLVDPEKRNASQKEHHTLQFYNPSPDGRYVLYGLQKSGAEETTLYVLDVSTGKDLADSIERVEPWYSKPVWLPDCRSFVYSQMPRTTPEMPRTEIWNNSRAYRHVLGENSDRDRLLLSCGQFPQVRIEPTDFPSIWAPKGSRYCVAQIKHGDQSELSLYSAPVESIGKPGKPWAKVCDVPDSVSDFTIMGDFVYLLTSKGAPRYKLVRTSLARPDFRRA